MIKIINQQEVSRHLNNFSSSPNYISVVDKFTAKTLLESEFVFCNGDLRDIRVKHLGLGVYKIYSEARLF